MERTILDVENLRIRYGGSPTEAVRGVSFTLGRERLGIVGESGSGKSTVARALLRLLPGATITADTLRFDNVDLLSLSEKEMLKIRGRRMSMILQDPKFSLNPIRRVGDQVAETYLRHFRCTKAEAKIKALVMLGSERFSLLPDIEASAENGVAGIDVDSWVGLFGPGGMDPALVEKLNADMHAALETESFRKVLEDNYVIAGSDTAAEFRAQFEEEMTLWKSLAEERSIVAQ